ncbi:MAG: hypothetical protein WEC75_03310 [Dehalococcoidia bacterium]
MVILASLAAGAFLAGACGAVGLDITTVQLDRDAYLTPIAEAQANGLAAYWLGESFDAGNQTYSYIAAEYPEGLGGVRVRGIELGYYTQDGAEWGLTLKTIPIGEWASVEEAVREPPGSPGPSAAEQLALSGTSADLLIYSSPTRPVSGYVLVIETEQSAVVVTVPSGGSATPGGPDANPLIDYDTFLAVMEELRPYPE